MFSVISDYRCKKLFKYIISEYLNQNKNRSITIELQDMVDNKMYRTQETAYREIKEFIESLQNNSILSYKLKGFSISMHILENYTFSYTNSNYAINLLLNYEFQDHINMFIRCISDDLIKKWTSKEEVNE